MYYADWLGLDWLMMVMILSMKSTIGMVLVCYDGNELNVPSM